MECESEDYACCCDLGEGHKGKEGHLGDGHVTDDDSVCSQPPDEDEGEDERESHPECNKLPMEGSGVQEHLHNSEHDERCHQGHDHVQEEDDSCVKICA